MLQSARNIKYFFYSQALADGFRMSFAILLPALTGLYFNQFQIGLTIALGAMCVSLTDAPGPAVHKRNGMLFTAGLAFLVAVVTGFARLNIYTLGLEIIVASFFFSMFNVYGNRAASVGNSGLLVLILTMDIAIPPAQVVGHASLILVGGIFYTLLSMALHALRPYRIAQRMLGDCLREIAGYLSIKADFYDPETDLDTNYRQLVAQQIEVHQKQEAVRELLFKSRQIVEESTAEGRRLVYTFVQAVDFFENVTAAYYDYSRLRERFATTGALEAICQTLKKMSEELTRVGFAIQSDTPFARSFNYDEELTHLKKEIDVVATKKDSNTLVLRKILVSIRRLFADLGNILRYFEADIKARKDKLDSTRFVTQQVVDVKTLWNNLSFQSSVFRHALRVSIACLAGFAIAQFVSYGHHSYWILMTIAFILKPAFSLTKQRNVQRIIGTVAGGALGMLILFFVPGKTIHFVFLVFFMIATYSFMRINYLVMVICTTPYVLILFSFLGSEFKSVVEERLLDTAIGCAIAFSTSYFLFPSWEVNQLKNDMLGILRANTNYLCKILEALGGSPINLLDYKLARKDVYLSSANLATTFQRMMSEPKSKQGSEKDVHEFVVLNHLLFSNIANLYPAVLSKETGAHAPEILLPGRKAINKLNECRKKLGEVIPIEREGLKKSTVGAKPGSADDLLLKDQLGFISHLASELEKKTVEIIG